MKYTLFIFALFTWMMHMDAQSFDWQGHRGCRGLMPENTVPAFLKAIELGVHTLEMDIVVSKDGELIISHEPWMSAEICSYPDGSPVTKKDAMGLNIYQMTASEVRQYDCGKRGDRRFPKQEKIPAHKPTLREAVHAVMDFCTAHRHEVPAFNIELKSRPDGYGIMVPQPDEFTGLVIRLIRELGIENSTTLQSFDINVLEELSHWPDRHFNISYLVQNSQKIMNNLDKLSFTPDIYSPYFRMVKKNTTKLAHALGMKVIPWTVNSRKKMRKLIRRNVDGIITDYPNLIFPVEQAG